MAAEVLLTAHNTLTSSDSLANTTLLLVRNPETANSFIIGYVLNRVL
jgi:hypothetical protein